MANIKPVGLSATDQDIEDPAKKMAIKRGEFQIIFTRGIAVTSVENSLLKCDPCGKSMEECTTNTADITIYECSGLHQ